jgi:hypothetical protein
MGPSLSVSYTIDPYIFVGVILASVVCLGVGTIAVGLFRLTLRSTRPASSDRVARHALAEIRRQLVEWQVALSPDDALVRAVMAVQSRVGGATLIGSGIGLLLALGSSIAVSLAATGSILATSALGGQVMVGALFCGGLLVGGSVGHWLGVQPYRRASSGIYADLRPRRLSDYRASILRWFPATLAVYDAALTVNLASQIGPSLRLELTGGSILVLPAFPTLFLLPAAMLLVWLSGEWLMRQAVALPRLVVTSDAAVSQRSDEMLRAEMIGVLQSATFLALGYFGEAQWALLTFQPSLRGPALIGWGQATAPLDLALLLAAVVGLPGFLLPAMRGRLGGAVTGWPWRARVAM